MILPKESISPPLGCGSIARTVPAAGYFLNTTETECGTDRPPATVGMGRISFAYALRDVISSEYDLRERANALSAHLPVPLNHAADILRKEGNS